MSNFFLRGKTRSTNTKRKSDRKDSNNKKRKLDSKSKSKEEVKKKFHRRNEEKYDESEEISDEDEDLKKFSEPEESDVEYETAEQKKLRLAKKYIEEIENEEALRAESRDIDKHLVSNRLRDDYLEQKGLLHYRRADKLKPPIESDISTIRCKEHKLTITCVCLSSDGNYLFSGSKCSSLVKWSLADKKKLLCLTFKSKVNISGAIAALAISSDMKYLASADDSKFIQIWDPVTLKHIYTFKGHKNNVTCLVFRKDSHDLYSGGIDKSIKVWSLNEMAYVETLFGHQGPVAAIDALGRERAISVGGQDNSIRIWKIVEESQLIFNGPGGSLDEVKLLDEEHFVSGGDDGSLCLWGVMKKKPFFTVHQAHGEENGVPRWIISLAGLLNSDVVASGSSDGFIRLWKVTEGYRKLLPLMAIAAEGFINGLQFHSSGKLLVAAVGQEHRLGRWWKIGAAKNSIKVINFNDTSVDK